MKANHLALAGLLALCVLLTQALSRTSAGPIGLDDDAKVQANPPVGKRVTVHLRRDALGLDNSFAASPVLDKYGNTEISLTGTLESLSDDWLVLDLNTGKYWVAREMVLLVATDQ